MLNKRDELRDRIEARRHELLSKFHELKADGRAEAAEARTKIKAKLDEIAEDVEAGWDKMTDEIRAKLNQWLDRP